jgi:hypothetical protein
MTALSFRFFLLPPSFHPMVQCKCQTNKRMGGQTPPSISSVLFRLKRLLPTRYYFFTTLNAYNSRFSTKTTPSHIHCTYCIVIARVVGSTLSRCVLSVATANHIGGDFVHRHTHTHTSLHVQSSSGEESRREKDDSAHGRLMQGLRTCCTVARKSRAVFFDGSHRMNKALVWNECQCCEQSAERILLGVIQCVLHGKTRLVSSVLFVVATDCLFASRF